MHPRYPELEFKWDMTTLQNPKQPVMESLYPGPMTVHILEGRMINHEKLIEDLRNLILKQEERLVKHTKEGEDDGNVMLEEYHLTTRYMRWNTFYIDHPAVEMLWNFIAQGHDKYLSQLNILPPKYRSIQSWGNVLRKGDGVSTHSHYRGFKSSGPADGYLSTNFCVTAKEDTSTIYDLPGYRDNAVEFRNAPGQLIVFPMWIPHRTSDFNRENDERITIASDISSLPHGTKSTEAGTIHDEERFGHWLNFNKSPYQRMRDNNYGEIYECRDIDPLMGRVVNHDGELTEEQLEEYINECENDETIENVYPKGVSELDEEEN